MQKSLRINFFGILHPKNCKNFIFCNFLNLATFLVNGQKIENLNFCNFLGCRIPKNLILRLFCIVNFFDISLLSSIKDPQNHIFAKYQIIFLHLCCPSPGRCCQCSGQRRATLSKGLRFNTVKKDSKVSVRNAKNDTSLLPL